MTFDQRVNLQVFTFSLLPSVMEANRWNEFRKDLERVYLRIKNDLGDVDPYFKPLVEQYPELAVDQKPKVKNEINEEEMNDEKMNEEEATCPKKQETKARRKKTKEEIKEILVESIKNQDCLTDYQHVKVKTETEQECLETLGTLNKAVVDARKRIVFFTAMQGKVLHKLRELTKCTVNDLIKKTGYSRSHVYFILKLHALVSEFNMLRLSNLKLPFFNTNMKIITEICEEDKQQFQ